MISDPTGKAVDIAEKLEVSVSPIILEQEPPPIALNGIIVDQEDGMKDNDPTTTQNFEDTSLEKALNKMKGRSLNVNLSSLDEEETKSLSKYLYNMLKKASGINYTHTCSPNSKPKIGDKGPNGGIINNITYNYSDSGSYLITVVEGDEFSGDFSGINSGIYKRQTEEINAVGTIIQSAGDHINFKVKVDGVGDIWAINSYPGVLEIKDKVNVTIHNNAVET